MSTEAQIAFRDELIAHGLLHATDVDGLYAQSGVFEDIIMRFNALVTRSGTPDGPEVLRFPPGMARSTLERSGYLRSFPQLAGTIHAFAGGDREHAALIAELDRGGDWTGGQKMTGIAFAPASCYPSYPIIAKRGPLPADGALLDVQSWCFRHEPSLDPARLQLFRQREHVRIGTPQQVLEFRERWLKRGRAIMESMGVPLDIDVANDPFFGRAGRMLAANQREQALKFELLVPITSTEKPTACCSFNYHQDHLGHAFGLHTADGAVAHTACVGFGLERIALALLRHHGFDPKVWPEAVRRALWG
jgi:seryl-tRNA synthetase